MIKSYIVDSTFNNMRFDRWLRIKLGKVPQGLIEKNLRSGKIKINKKKVKSSFKIKTNDKVDIFNLNFEEYEKIISKSKLEAKNIFSQSREKVLKDIGAKREVLDKQIDEEISKAEQEINNLRESAPNKINMIAIETSSELIQKLIGAEVNNSSISAIVDDLSRRNGDKYYGN